MIRVQAIVLPILREALDPVSVVSQLPDVDYRTFPMVYVRRVGGSRNPNLPGWHSRPVVELSAYSTEGLVEAEELHGDAIDALYAAVSGQTVVPGVGYLQSIPEAQEGSQALSELPDTWRVAGRVELVVRLVS